MVPPVGAANLPPATLRIQPVWISGTTPHVCHSDRSVSGVEESTTLVNEPTQNKTCYSGRFLDSLRSLGMTCRYVVSFNHTGHICNVAGGKIAAPTSPLKLKLYFRI